MATKIKTQTPGTTLHWDGEQYVSDKDGLVSVPDAAAKVFVESHGCVNPADAHPYGLRVADLGKGRYQVTGPDGPVHSGYLPANAAYALLKSWTPNTSEGDKASEKEADEFEEEGADTALQQKQARGLPRGDKQLKKA